LSSHSHTSVESHEAYMTLFRGPRNRVDSVAAAVQFNELKIASRRHSTRQSLSPARALILAPRYKLFHVFDAASAGGWACCCSMRRSSETQFARTLPSRKEILALSLFTLP